MDTRRMALAIAVALVLSLSITGMFYLRFARQQAANRKLMITVVAAAKEIPPGVPIAADSLKRIEWPNGLAIHGAVTKEDEVVGHSVIAKISANEPIFEHDLSSPGNSGLSARIPDGMRAVAVKTDEVNNLAGFLFPGSRVDVLATLRGQSNTSYNVTVLQNVEVLSAGEKIVADPSGKPQNVKLVTLLVTPQESQKLELATGQGTIQLSLRNQHDDQKIASETLGVADLENVAQKPVQHSTATAKGNAPPKRKPASTYTVETIAGTKTSVATFAAGGAR